MKSDKTKCIYNGIDVDHYKDHYSGEERLEFRRKLGFTETAYVVGICARLHSGKKHTELIAALDTIRRAGIDAKILIVGDGPERANIESFIKSKGLEQHVVITGFQKDIRPFISVSDCIALTSQGEAFPLSIIEGMAMGKPVISSEVGGTPEQIEHGVTGFLYRSGDIDNLAKYLKVLSDPALRSSMGGRARQSACDRFSLGRMIGEYTSILSETVTMDTGLPR
jgi:glycosyltransferase involved in cell wall biosynthesis